MSGRDILPIFPSRANFVLMKQRIAAATTGLSLLKRKRDALELHMRQLINELKIYQNQINEIMQEAIFSMTKAKFLATDFKPAAIEQPDRADAYLHVKPNKIVGMNVPSLQLVLRPATSLPLTGLSSGGQQVEIVRSKFQEALKILTAIASLEYNLSIVREAVKLNNRRVNGLEYVVVPRYQNTLNYIRDELDEFEREDFYRLKRSQGKQNKKKTEFIALMRGRAGEPEAQEVDIDIADWTNKAPGFKQIGLKGDPSAAVTRKTIVSLRGNTLVLIPEDQMRPTIIESRGKSLIAAEDEELTTRNVVTTSSSSSLSSVPSSTYRRH